MSLRKAIKDTTVGVMLAVVFIIIHGIYMEMRSPTPYRNVTVDSLVVLDTSIEMQVTFEKVEGCVFQSLVAVGGNLGVFTVLEWEDLDTPRGDRIAGYHTLRLNIITGNETYDRIELRTRHDCDGRTTDRILAAEDL